MESKTMSVENTVMCKVQVNEILKRSGQAIPSWVEWDENHPDYQLCLAQAKISFKAGQEQATQKLTAKFREFLADWSGEMVLDEFMAKYHVTEEASMRFQDVVVTTFDQWRESEVKP